MLITDVAGMTQVNWTSATIKGISAKTFKLSGVDSSGYSAYTSGGYAGKQVTTISGLSHLEGKTVDVLADGSVHPALTVASGAITLQRKSARVHIGLPFTSIIQSLRPEARGTDGTIQGKIKSINSLVVRFYRAVGCKVGLDGDNLDLIPFRTTSDKMGRPVDLFSGDKIYPLMSGYNRDGFLWVEQTQPLPMSVVALMAELNIGAQ